MSWKRAIGPPNCLRSRAYCLERWKQLSAAPRTPQAIPYLALFKQLNGPLKEKIFDKYKRKELIRNIKFYYISKITVTFQSFYIQNVFFWNNHILHHYHSSDGSSQRQFSFNLGVVIPFIPLSKRNPLISPFSSLAQTTKTSAIGELEIQVFVPFKT